MKKLISLIILLNIVAVVYGAGLNLLSEEDLEVFEVKKSTDQTITEEFNNFSGEREWLRFEGDLWDKIISEKEKGVFEVPKADFPVYEGVISTGAAMGEIDMPQAEISLPYQARLSISGSKSISVKYGTVIYKEKDEDERTVSGAPSGTTKGFEMEQELKVRIKGKVGEKITVNVNYDDTKSAYDENARKISVLYKGDQDELIKEAAFGDITLSIPSTKFVGYSKSVFGATVKGKYKKLNFMAIGSQTKGKTDTKEFTGKTTFTKKDIKDKSYTRRKYYNIDLDTATTHLPIVSGSVNIYIADMDVSNNTENNESTMTVTYVGSTQTYTGSFYSLIPGKEPFGMAT